MMRLEDECRPAHDKTVAKRASGGQPIRLYVKGTVVGFRRGAANSGNHYNHTSLVSVEGLKSRSDVDWYLGKKIAYIFKAKTKKKNTNYRVIWGKVVAAHGSKGLVRAKFRKNLPPQSLGAPVRVMLYPSRV